MPVGGSGTDRHKLVDHTKGCAMKVLEKHRPVELLQQGMH